MAKFGIYSAAGVKKAEGYTTFTGTYMKAGVLDFREIASPIPIDWAVGDYVDYTRTGRRYKLYTVPQVRKQARNGSYGGAFVYQNVQFFDDSHQADICPFRDLVPGDNRVHFSTQPQISVFDNVAGIAERLQACLEDMYGAGSWVVRTATAQDGASQELLDLMADEREFIVSGVSITGALEKVYELWPEVGFVYTIESGVNTLIIGGAGLNANEDTYKYGKGYGLTSIAKTVANADDMANRLYVYGSSKNMLSRWYSQFDIKDADSVDIQHLMLPISVWGTTDDKPDPAKAFIETPSAASNLRPKTVYFDGTQDLKEIYPTIRETTIQELWDVMAQDAEFRPNPSVWTGAERIDTILSAQSTFDSGLAADNGKSAIQNLSWDAAVSTSTSRLVKPNFSIPLFAREFTLEESGSLNFDIVLNANGTVSFPNTQKVVLRARIHKGSSDTYPTFIDQSIELDKDTDSGAFIIAPASFSASRVQFNSTSGILVSFFLEFTVNGSTGSQTLAINMNGSLNVAVSRYRAKTFNVTLRQLGFDISAQANLGEGKTMVMRSGKCVGRAFKIASTSYNSTTDTWDVELIRSNDESLSQWFPNNDYPVEADDEFVLTEIAMPGIYISLAENRLLAAAQELLADTSKEQWQYTPDIDAKFMIESGRTILPATNVTLEDEIVPGGSVSMLVDSVTINEGDAAIPTYKLTLRDKKRKSYSDTASVQEPSSTPVSTVQQAVTPAQRTVINDSFFEEDGNGNIKLKDVYGGLWTQGFVTAGGVGSGGGGGGGLITDVYRVGDFGGTFGINDNDTFNAYAINSLYTSIQSLNTAVGSKIDRAVLWASLQNNDIVSTYNNYKIAGAHIPDMAETYGYLKSADIDAYLQSLQSQIDSVAARTNFDDLVVTSLFSDAASVSSLYAETIYLGGTSIASSLSSLSTAISNEATARANADSGLSTAISNEATARANADSALSSAIDGVASRATTLEGYFDANGNAKSALKLTTVSKTIWGQTYWTSGGVPQNVTAAPNLYIGGSKVQTSQAAQALVGISSISAAVSPGSDDNTKIEWDADANAWHFHGGIYADAFVTAGGEGSGGSVPTTLDAVWNTLRYNTGDYQDVQIDVAHIPGLPWSKIISGKPSSLAGYGILDAYTKTEVDNLIGAIDQFHYEIYPSLSDITTPAGNVLYLIGPTGSGSDKYEEYVYANGSFTKIGDTTIDLSAYLTITSAQATYQPIISDLATIRTQAGHGETAYNSLDTISDCLQSLQSQIDSVATRNDFDELNASSVFSDIVAATSFYAGSIALGGNDLATTLSNLSGRIGTVEGKFTGDSANSALRLAGTSAYSIWGVEYWSSGVPKSVTGRPGLFIGSTQVKTSSATQDLAGIGSITATGALTLSSTKKIYFGDSTHYIELDADGYFHFSHGLYSEGFVTAGGQGTGGGGGGVDLERVWQSLTNNTDFPDVKINVAHIPDMANVYGYLKGNQTITLTGVVTGSGTTSIATSIANNALSIAMVNGLQAALDSKTSNVGTVTSVGLSMPTGFSVSGTPITASGTFSVSFASGYSLLTSAQASTWDGKQDAISDLATIRTNASNGNTAYGWGNHANAGYFAASSFTASNIVSTIGNTAVNRATADAAGENIASNFTMVESALKSLQSQIDSVASRIVYDELTATNLYSDMAVGVSAYFSNFYGNLTGTASNAANADNADKLDGVHASGLFTELTTSAGSTNLYITIGGTRLSKTIYAYYDSDGGIIASNMTTIGTALRSLQSQIDSVATNRSFDDISITSAFVDMLSVGSNVNVGGTIHSIGGIDSNSYITAGATGSSSDARLKDNIEEVSAARAIELLSALKGKEWTWNGKKEYLAGKHGSGLIAQEVLPIMPWAVLDLNGEYSLNYNTLWGVAIPVMQSHEQRIEALERENKELKRKIEILTNNS